MQIRVHREDAAVNAEMIAFIERRLYLSLGRFGGRLRSAVVSLRELNGSGGGPGGVTRECHVSVRFTHGGTVAITERHGEMREAVARAVERTARTVSRKISLMRPFDSDPAA